MKEKRFVTTDNIFADLGLEDAEELKTRSDLLSEVVSIIRKSGLKNKEIAVILRISEPKVSSLLSGKMSDFSNDTLMHYLTLLGVDIEINLKKHHPISKKGKRGMVKVRRKTGIRKRSISLTR